MEYCDESKIEELIAELCSILKIAKPAPKRSKYSDVEFEICVGRKETIRVGIFGGGYLDHIDKMIFVSVDQNGTIFIGGNQAFEVPYQEWVGNPASLERRLEYAYHNPREVNVWLD